MKKALIAIMLAGAVCNSPADVKFRWNPPAGSLKNNSGSDIAVGGATVLTYVSGDTVIDFPSNGILQASYGSGAGADSFIGVGVGNAALAGRYITPYYDIPGNDYVGKYVYAIILNMPASSFTTLSAVPVGTYYGVTTIGKIGGVDTPLVAFDSFNAAATTLSYTGGNVQTTLQVIPEPAVAGLVALGAAVVAIRRYRARRRE